MKNKKVANINISLKDLFSKWLEVTSFLHKLTNQQKEVLSLFLYYHYKYKSEITNETILWKVLFDYDTKMLIKEELNMKDAGFQNVLTKLRKKNIIHNNRISKLYIPEITKESNRFQIVFNFNIVDGQSK